MGIFNYIDTFFFISLGITFILILLLVFHFKQRVADLEEKTTTMFEIINNIVKELNSTKELCCLANTIRPSVEKIPIDLCCAPINREGSKPEKIIVSDPENELSDDESEYDSEDEDEDEEDDDEDEEDEDDEDDEDELPALLNISEEVITGDDNVKIITVEIGDTIEVGETLEVSEIENSEEEKPEEIVNLEASEELHVEKLETDTPEETLATEEPIVELPAVETSKEIYRKMTLQALKSLVITKGLCSDPSKMKKNDLLKLLESNDEQ
jgi:hypothetical protein